MKRSIPLVLLSLLIIAGFSACDECANYDQPFYGFSFRIVDEDFKELVGVDRPYDHKDIQLLADGTDLITTFNYDQSDRLYTFTVSISGLDLFNEIPYSLVLSPTESLPMEIQVRRTDGNCSDRFTLDYIKLQGSTVDISTDPIFFIREN